MSTADLQHPFADLSPAKKRAEFDEFCARNPTWNPKAEETINAFLDAIPDLEWWRFDRISRCLKDLEKRPFPGLSKHEQYLADDVQFRASGDIWPCVSRYLVGLVEGPLDAYVGGMIQKAISDAKAARRQLKNSQPQFPKAYEDGIAAPQTETPCNAMMADERRNAACSDDIDLKIIELREAGDSPYAIQEKLGLTETEYRKRSARIKAGLDLTMAEEDVPSWAAYLVAEHFRGDSPWGKRRLARALNMKPEQLNRFLDDAEALPGESLDNILAGEWVASKHDGPS